MVKIGDGLYRLYTEFQSERPDLFAFANGVLYEMCEREPLHKNVDVIAGKLLLIGRSYAAAIERGEGTEGDSDVYYYQKVAPKIRDSDLDKRIALLRRQADLSDCILDADKDKALAIEAILIHRYLEEEVFPTTKTHRSLSSKYLHFHCPKAVYIYDERANSTLRKWVQYPEKAILEDARFVYGKTKDKTHANFDEEYANFICRVLELRKYLKESGAEGRVSPRDIDDFLLWLHSNKKQ